MWPKQTGEYTVVREQNIKPWAHWAHAPRGPSRTAGRGGGRRPAAVAGRLCNSMLLPYDSVRLKRGSHTNDKKNKIGQKIIDFHETRPIWGGEFFENVLSSKGTQKNSQKWGAGG